MSYRHYPTYIPTGSEYQHARITKARPQRSGSAVVAKTGRLQMTATALT